MAKGRKKHTDSWIQVVTILTVVGLIALGALGVYYFMQYRSEQHTQQTTLEKYFDRHDNRKKMATNKPWQKRWIRPITPQRVSSLKHQVEMPLEIVRNKPAYLRPKNRREYIRDRVSRLDRNISFGQGGIFAQELKAALCNERERPQVFGFIAGLGGRDITPTTIEEVIARAEALERPQRDIEWVDIRGPWHERRAAAIAAIEARWPGLSVTT